MAIHTIQICVPTLDGSNLGVDYAREEALRVAKTESESRAYGLTGDVTHIRSEPSTGSQYPEGFTLHHFRAEAEEL